MAERTRKLKVTDEQIIEAVMKAQGFVYLAAKSLNCSHTMIYDRAKKNVAIREAIDTPMQINLDIAEGRLLQLVNKGDFQAIKFFLTTKGRRRGYSEKSEVMISGTVRYMPPTIVKSKTDGE